MSSKIREIMLKDRELILWLFDNRCVRCHSPARIIHEIVPISHGKSGARIKNRVVICNDCHLWAHESTKVSIPILTELRKKFLIEKFDLDTISKGD